MGLYILTDPDRPHLVLFSATTLAEAAAALAARPDPGRLAVSFNEDGFSRPLDSAEQAELARGQSGPPPTIARDECR
jgi:hypothetical protein